jgi:hypothetical protein
MYYRLLQQPAFRGPVRGTDEISLAHVDVLFVDELPEFRGLREQMHPALYDTTIRFW